MGMYNEVFCPCPKCDGEACAQISQIVLGFGGFYLDNPETMLELDDAQLARLKEEVMEAGFVCRNEDCRHYFKYFASAKMREKRIAKIEKMFAPPDEDEEDA